MLTDAKKTGLVMIDVAPESLARGQNRETPSF